MSSGQGSIANKQNGGYGVYRGTKAALNNSCGASPPATATTRGRFWSRPGLVANRHGGSEARLNIQDSIPNLVNTIEARAGEPGLQYLDISAGRSHGEDRVVGPAS